MNVSHLVEEALSRISIASSLDDLRSINADLREPFGLAHIVYHAVRIPRANASNPLLLLTYDPEWVHRYTERNYFIIDPIVQSGRKGFLPLDWSEVDRETPTARQFFAEADLFGVGRQGVTLPIRGPDGERALFTVTANASEAEWRKRRLLYMREFQLIAHFFHDRAILLSNLREKNREPTLSHREKECLQGTIRGHAPKRIASELSLSTSAVRLYLSSARHKLSCHSISEAAVKAFYLDLFDL